MSQKLVEKQTSKFKGILFRNGKYCKENNEVFKN